MVYAFHCVLHGSQVTSAALANNPSENMTDTRIALLLTRPLRQAKAFAERFHGHNLQICLSPLFKIVFRGDLPDLTPYQSLLFTSANAVEAFAQQVSNCQLPSFTVGQASADAARAAGLPATSLGLNVTELIATLRRAPPATPCLHACGAITYGNLAAQLTQVGIPTDAVVLYAQLPVPLQSDARLLLRGTAPVIVPLFSARSAELFNRALGQSGGAAPIYPVVLSSAVAAVLTSVKIATPEVAEAPTAAAMEEAVNLVHARLMQLEQTAGAP